MNQLTLNQMPIEEIVATTVALQEILDQAVCPIIIRDTRAKLDTHRAYLRSINYQEENGIATYDRPAPKVYSPVIHPMEDRLMRSL